MPIDNWWNEIFAGVGGQQQGTQQTSTGSSSDWWNDILAPAQPGSQWYRGEANPSILSEPIGSTASWNPFAEGPWRGFQQLGRLGMSYASSLYGFGGAILDGLDRAKQSYYGLINGDVPEPDANGSPDLFFWTKYGKDWMQKSEDLRDWQQILARPSETGSALTDVQKQLSEGMFGPKDVKWGELASDTLAAGGDMLLDMAGAAAAGGTFGKAAQLATKAITGAELASFATAPTLAGRTATIVNNTTSTMSDAIGTGFAMQMYGDAYQAQAEHESTGLVSDVLWSASSSGLQGYLERLGVETWMGKGAIAALVKSKLGASRTVNAAVGALIGQSVESGEEGAQQITQILADTLPQLDVRSGDEVVAEISKRIAEEVPTAMLGGALLGGPMSAIGWGYNRPGMGDVAARAGAKAIEARELGQANLASLVQALNSDETAKERATKMVLSMPLEEIQSLQEQAEAAAINKDTPPDMVVQMQRVSNELLRLQQIAAENAEASLQAAKDANEQLVLSEADTSAEIASSLDATQVQQLDSGVGKGIQAQVQAATDAVLQLQSVWEQAQEQVQMQQQMAGMAPGTINIEVAEAMQGAQVAFQQAAQQLGIQLSPEQLANPNSIDWQTLAFTAGVEAEARAKTAIRPVVGVIAKAVDVPQGGAIEQIVTQEAELDQAAGISNILTGKLSLHKEEGYGASVGSLADGNKRQLMVDPNGGFFWGDYKEAAVRDTGVQTVGEHASFTPATFKTQAEARSAAQSTPQDRTSPLGAVPAPSVKQGKSDRQKQLQRARQARYRARKKAALAAPQAPLKSVTTLRVLRDAVALEDAAARITGRNPRDSREQVEATELVHRLFRVGNVKALKAIAKLDSVTEEEGAALLREAGVEPTQALLSYGAQAVTPYSIYTKVVESGGTHEDGLAAVAVTDAWASRYVARGRGTKQEFYRRLAAGLISGPMQPVEAQLLGGPSTHGVFWANHIGRFAQGIVRLFSHAESKGLVMVHELVHAMHVNMLLPELLDETDMKALEDFIGEPLYDKYGWVAEVSDKAKEKLAVGFTTFLGTHRAPNAKLHNAFSVMKNALKTVINRFLRLTNGNIRNRTVDSYLAGEHMLTSEREEVERVGDLERAGWSDVLADVSFAEHQAYETPNWKFDWLEIDVSNYPAAVRAMYHLLNAEPVHPSVGNGARSLTDAVEQELDQATGLPAKGWISKPLKLTAWHGTPHKFDKFSIDKIGTGEGAQAYGWGLYFAGKKDVAKYYKDKLGDTKHTITFYGKKNKYNQYLTSGWFNDIRPKLLDAARKRGIEVVNRDVTQDFLDYKLEDIPTNVRNTIVVEQLLFEVVQAINDDQSLGTMSKDESLKSLLSYLENMEDNSAPSVSWLNKQERLLLAEELFKNTEISEENRGALYKVDLKPKEEEYLLWDRPLKEQSPLIKRALDHIGIGDVVTLPHEVSPIPMNVFSAEKNKERQVRRIATTLKYFLYSKLDISDGVAQTAANLIWKSIVRGKVDLSQMHDPLTLRIIREYLSLVKSGSEAQTGENIYKNLAAKMGKQKASMHMRSLGIRGIKYLNGFSRAKGEGDYNYVIFDDADVEIMEVLKKTSDTPPSGYTMDQGRTPTPYEMRKMSGLTNDNFNGAIAEDALKGMEEVAELIGDVSREVMQPLKFAGSGKLTSDQKKQLATSLTNEAELAANQATQDMLLDGAPLIGSVLNEQYKEHVANAWIAGGKDAYFWGQKVDPTNPEQTKGMLHNFAFGMMSFWDRVKNGEFKKALQVALKPLAKGGLSTFQYLEGRVGSYSAPFERFLHDLGLPLVSEQYNNFYAISKLADKLVDNIPSIYDPATSTYKPIPGAKSWKNIMSDYNTMVKAFWTANKNILTQKTPKEFHDAAHRDLKLWMLANRQLELAKTVAEGKALYEARVEAWVKAGKKEADKPKPPRLPHVSPAFTQMAEATIRMIRASWGSDAIAILDRTALELTKWENHMVLDKLLAAGMITSKEHKDMFGRGTRHIPFHRIRDAVERSGALNVRLDASMYKVLDYLKEDLSMSVEDPLNAMLRKAKAIEILTLRQHAKNEIGMKMLTTTWWRGENGYTILHKNVEITKEEFEKLKNQPGVAFTKNVKSKSLATGQVRTSTKFYKRVLLNAEDFANAKRDLIRNAIAKAKKIGRAGAGVGQEETDAAGLSDALDMNIFAFYPEEGSPRYVMFTDEDLARSVFYANNPQAVFARSIVDGWTKRLEGVQQDPKSPALVKGIAGGAKFVLGANKAFASLITSSPKYLYNVIFRDLTPALVRSRHGLRIRDIATTFATEGWAAAFPSLREVSPEKYPVSASAGYGTGEFSGLVNAINKDGVLDAQESSWLTWGRSEMLAKASDKNATKWQRGRAKLALMNEDFKQFMAKRGLHQSPTDLFAKAKAGELEAGDYVYMASSPFKFPFALMQMIGVTLENTTRLAERRMTMIEDMSKYPRLAHLYQPDSRGTKLAGFSGNTHRRAWEAEKKKMEANPTYMPEPANMPIMYSDVEKDYSMAHVTLNFSQRGTWTHDIQSQHMFWNPMAQDFYTNMMIIAQHSKLKGALNFMLGEEKLKMAENQPQLDSKAFAWFLKAMSYVFLPTIAMAAYYGGLPDDDPDKQEWLNQSFIEKMSYFHIPIPFMDRNEDGTHTKLRIATGLGMATLFFHDLPLAIWLDWASGQDPDAMRKWATRLFDNTPLNLVLNPAWAAVESMIDPNATGEEAIRSAAGSVLGNELINPMVELYGNYDEFRQKEIKYGTPSPLDHTEVARDRYNILTNTIAKVWPGGLQPSQAGYLVRRYFPGLAGVIPKAANLGMEAVAGATNTMPPDVAESESPVYGQVGGVSPNFTAREPWGPGNEFVQDMYKLARTAEGQYNAYNHKPESGKPSYLAQNPLIKPDIYWDLINTKDSVTLAERARKELLQDESIPLEERKKLAMEMERTYTLLAAEVVRATMKKL